MRKAKNNYYQDKFHEYNRKIKQTWNVLRKVLKSNNLKSDIPDQFHCNGKIFSGLQEISEGFTIFFVNVGPNLASVIPAPKQNFTEYLSTSVDTNFVFANVTPKTISETLSLLKSKISCGKDNISTKLLKAIMPYIISPVVHMKAINVAR